VVMEKTFGDLRHQFQVLQDALEALSTTVEEDRPTRDDVVVAASLNDAVLAARGLLEESRSAADDACRTVVHPLNADRARQTLITCQERFHGLAHHFLFELATYERIDDLRSVADERGAEWRNWVTVIREELDQCRVQVEVIRCALFLCWQELAERIGASAVSVQNTTIGQQISLAERGGEAPHQNVA
jgi:hypothetical protein